MRCFLSHRLSFRRVRAAVPLFWRRWLRACRALAGREALARLRRGRFVVLRLEILEERVVPASTQEAVTPSILWNGAALLRDNQVGAAAVAFMGDLAHLRNDVATSALTLSTPSKRRRPTSRRRPRWQTSGTK